MTNSENTLAPVEGRRGAMLCLPLPGGGFLHRLCGERPNQRAYFIENVETGRIKVGRARNPGKRLRSLQTGSDCRLRIIGHIPADDATEARLHELLRQHHVRGEWYAAAARPTVIAILDNEPSYVDAIRRRQAARVRGKRARAESDAAFRAGYRHLFAKAGPEGASFFSKFVGGA